jgi:uncharacterized damage-inducible protein DinB
MAPRRVNAYRSRIKEDAPMTSPVVSDADRLRFPVGNLVTEPAVTPEQRRLWIRQMDETPARLAEALAGLTEAQLGTPYRDGGWTPRQVVHHLADSHMNGFARFKLALTETTPAIKTYEEDLWAETPDAREAPVEISLALLTALHRRFTILLESLTDAQWARTFQHPQRGLMTIDDALQLYAWHGRHHTGHVTGLRARQGW